MALDELQSKQLFGDHWSLFAEANGHVKGGKHRTSLAKQISCKWQELINKSMKICGDFSHFFFSRSIVSPWQKTTFFSKRSQALARFSPDGLFMAHRVAHIRHINRNSMVVIESFPSIPIFYHFFFHFQTVENTYGGLGKNGGTLLHHRFFRITQMGLSENRVYSQL
jgi:predicted metalloprotease with PDZ domain